MYRASAGSTYPTLQQLEADGHGRGRDAERAARLPADQGRAQGSWRAIRVGVKRIWDRAEACEDWGQAMGPETIWLWGPVGMLIKESMRAAGRAGSDRVREILDRARREMEEL